jgi:hypothetical protein
MKSLIFIVAVLIYRCIQKINIQYFTNIVKIELYEDLDKKTIVQEINKNIYWRTLVNYVGFLFGYGYLGYYDIYESHSFLKMIKQEPYYSWKYKQIKQFQKSDNTIIEDIFMDTL